MVYLSNNPTAIEYAKLIIDDKENFQYLNTWFNPVLYNNNSKVDDQLECSVHTFLFEPKVKFNNLTKQDQATAIDSITTEFIREADCNQIDTVAKVNYYPTEQKLQISVLGYW